VLLTACLPVACSLLPVAIFPSSFRPFVLSWLACLLLAACCHLSFILSSFRPFALSPFRPFALSWLACLLLAACCLLPFDIRKTFPAKYRVWLKKKSKKRQMLKKKMIILAF
jgi:hypothetical protein